MVNPVEVILLSKINGMEINKKLDTFYQDNYQVDPYLSVKNLLKYMWVIIETVDRSKYTSYTVEELKKELKFLNLKVSGKKNELIKRVEGYYSISNPNIFKKISLYKVTELGQEILVNNEAAIFFHSISNFSEINIYKYYEMLNNDESYQITLIKMYKKLIVKHKNDKKYRSWQETLNRLLYLYDKINLENLNEIKKNDCAELILLGLTGLTDSSFSPYFVRFNYSALNELERILKKEYEHDYKNKLLIELERIFLQLEVEISFFSILEIQDIVLFYMLEGYQTGNFELEKRVESKNAKTKSLDELRKVKPQESIKYDTKLMKVIKKIFGL